MLILFFTIFFWSLASYPFHRKIGVSLFISLSALLLLWVRSDWITGASYYNHVDTIGNLQGLFSLDGLLKKHSLLDYISGWNPHISGGIPLLSKYYSLFYLLYFLNHIDPSRLGLPAVHNLMSVNYALLFAIGILLVSHRLTKKWAGPLFIFLSVFIGNLTLASNWEETARWFFLQPYVFLCFLVWFQTGKPRLFALAFGLLAVHSTMYLINGTLLLLGCFSLLALVKRPHQLRAHLSTLVQTKSSLALLGLTALLTVGAVLPIFQSYLTTKNYSDAGRRFTEAYTVPQGSDSEIPTEVSGHVAQPKDFLSVLLDRGISLEFFSWRLSGPFGLGFAITGFVVFALFRRRLIVWGLGLAVLVLGYFSLGPSMPGVSLMYHLPFLKLLRHTLILFGDMSFCLAILSAFGLTALLECLHSFQKQKRFLVAPLACFLLPLSAQFIEIDGSLFKIQSSFLRTAYSLLQLLVGWLAFMGWNSSQPKQKRTISIAALILVFGSTAFYLCRFHRLQYTEGKLFHIWNPIPYASYPAFNYPETRACVAGLPQNNEWRNGSACTTKAIPLLSGIVPYRFMELLSAAYPERVDPKNTKVDLSSTAYRREYKIFGNDKMPLFFFTNGYEVSSGLPKENELSQLISHYQTEAKPKAFFYDSDTLPELASRSQEATVFEPVKLLQEESGPRKLSFKTQHSVPGFLVQLENFSPGWEAWVDGIKTPLFSTNYAFRSLPVAAGSHHIVLKYHSLYGYGFWAHQMAVFWLCLWLLMESSVLMGRAQTRASFFPFPFSRRPGPWVEGYQSDHSTRKEY